MLRQNVSSRPRGPAVPEPTAADRLSDIAHRVERLGRGARGNPEILVLEKFEIAGDLRRIAREVAQPSPRAA